MKFGKVLQSTKEQLFPEMGAMFLRVSGSAVWVMPFVHPMRCSSDGVAA